jgi:hypothetical protein
MLSESQIEDVVGSWARQRPELQKLGFVSAGVLKDGVQDELVKIVSTHLEGNFSFTNLDRALLLRKEMKTQREREQDRKDALYQEIEKVVDEQFSGLAKQRHNYDRIVALCKNPDFTANDFVGDVVAHPGAWAWTEPVDLVALLRKTSKAQVLAQGYDPAQVQEAEAQLAKSIHGHAEAARPSWKGDPASKQDADAAAAQRKLHADPKQIEKAMAACVDIVDRLYLTNNRAENDRGKEALEQVSIYTNGLLDPFKTLEARQAWIKNYIPEAERRR